MLFLTNAWLCLIMKQAGSASSKIVPMVCYSVFQKLVPGLASQVVLINFRYLLVVDYTEVYVRHGLADKFYMTWKNLFSPNF